MNDRNLFIVEFGEPHAITMFNFSPNISIKPIYVIANDYSDASNKANMYLKRHLKTNSEVQSILDSDGSLKNNIQKPVDIQVISVKLLSDNLIW